MHRKSSRLGGANRDNANKIWKKLNGTAALSYAASTIELDDQFTLLDAIRNGEASYELHGKLLPQWLARARYAADKILRGLPEPRFAQANRASFPSSAPEPTPEPNFTAKERATIIAAFDIKRILAGRGQTEREARSGRKAS